MPKSALSTEERHKKILFELNQKEQIMIDDLVDILNVSPSTIRRDLTEMERRGFLRRIHGGAEIVQPLLYEPFRHSMTFSNQEGINAEAKRKIAQASAEMILPGETIAITAGTTTTQITRYLGHINGISLITNTVNVAMELSQHKNLKVIVTGGELSSGWFSLVGDAALQTIRNFYFDKVFVGLNGIDPERGLTSHYVEEASVVRAMIKQAKKKIVVADSTKIGNVAKALICGIEEIDVLITDKGISQEKSVAFEKIGLEIISV